MANEPDEAKRKIVSRLRGELVDEGAENDWYTKSDDITGYGKNDFLKAAPPGYEKVDEYAKKPA